MNGARSFAVDALTVRVHDSLDALAADAAREVEDALAGAIAAAGAPM